MTKKPYNKPSVKVTHLHSMVTILAGSVTQVMSINEEEAEEVEGVSTSGIQW